MPGNTPKYLSIIELVQNSLFKIPEFQRKYSWGKKEVTRFLKDFDNVYKNESIKPKEYFFGPMIFHGSPRNIIDGQQRLVTVSLLTVAIRDIYNHIAQKLSQDQKSSEIEEQICNLEHYIKNNNQPRIELEENDQILFWRMVNNIKSPNDKIKENQSSNNLNFLQTYKFIIKWLNKKIYSQEYDKEKKECEIKIKNTKTKISEFKKNQKEITDLEKIQNQNRKELQTLDRKYYELFAKDIPKIISTLEAFKVLEFDDEQKRSHLIFETLNHRGKKLTTSELFKNYILYKSTDNEYNNTITQWNTINDNVDARIEDFLLHYYLAHYKKVSKDELFEQYKMETIEEGSVKKLIESMVESSESYKKLIGADRQVRPPTLKTTLSHFSELGSTSFHPVLLCAFEYKFKPKDIEKLAKNCVSLLIRHKTVLERRADELIDLSVTLSKEIRDNKLKKMNDLFKEKFEDVFDNDDERIVSELSKKKFKTTSHAKLIIREIYKKLGNKIDKDDELEHIIPQSVYNSKNDSSENIQKWKKYLEDNNMDENSIYRLGNFTLLTREEQESALDYTWEIKSEIYKKSDIGINKELGKLKSFAKEFEERCSTLAKEGPKIWKLDFE